MSETPITRVEVIDHYNRKGRAYTFGPVEGVKVEQQLQDGGRTLKIFISRDTSAGDLARLSGIWHIGGLYGT